LIIHYCNKWQREEELELVEKLPVHLQHHSHQYVIGITIGYNYYDNHILINLLILLFVLLIWNWKKKKNLYGYLKYQVNQSSTIILHRKLENYTSAYRDCMATLYDYTRKNRTIRKNSL